MFARTERLLLRPGWAEDAPALARAIADEAVVRNLATAPWPYDLADAEAFLAAPRDPALPSFLITERTDGAPRLIARPLGTTVDIGYVLARAHWGQGFATEAGEALIAIACTLKLQRLEASHFIDNPASGRVLEKLGFAATGLSAARYSCARGAEAMSRLYSRSLAACGEVQAIAA